MREYNYKTVYEYFNNSFPIDCSISYLNLPPMPLVEIYRPKKDPAIHQFSLQLNFLLPLEIILVILIPLLAPHMILS